MSNDADNTDTCANAHVSVLALLPLACAVAAPFVLEAALAGVPVGLFAIWHVSTSHGRLRGQWLALVGLLLCVAVVLWRVFEGSFRQFR